MAEQPTAIRAPADRALPGSRLAHAVWRRRGLYAFLLPMLAFLIVFSYYPAVAAIAYAFTEFDGIDAQFVGLANFAALASDPTFRASLWNVLRLALFHITIGVWVPFLVAELLFHLRGPRARYLYRVFFVVPMVVPFVATILIWKFIYEPNFGVLNTLLRGLGLGQVAGALLGDPHVALYAVMGVGFPWVGPFALLIYLAGLQAIAGDVLDAARVDGCVGWRRIVAIDIPLVLGQIKVIFILQLIASFQSLVSVLILTDGGPADATMTPGVYMYKTAFYYYKMGYASAIGVLLLLTVFGLTYLSLSVRRPALEHAA